MTFAPSGRFRNLLGRETLNQLARHPFRISQKHLEVFETSSTGTNFKGPWRQTSKQMEKVELSCPRPLFGTPSDSGGVASNAAGGKAHSVLSARTQLDSSLT